MSVASIFGRGLSMKQFIQTNHMKLDHEWIELIQEAQKLGLTIEEVQHFLRTQPTDDSLHTKYLQTPISVLIST